MQLFLVLLYNSFYLFKIERFISGKTGLGGFQLGPGKMSMLEMVNLMNPML